jgi:hypothetical protein
MSMTQSKSSSLSLRRGLLWLPILALVAIAGVVAGFFLPTGSEPDAEFTKIATSTPEHELATKMVPPVAEASPRVAPRPIRSSHEFPLSAADMRDTQESPAIAIDHKGRIYLAWASKTSGVERTLYFTTAADRTLAFDEPRVIAKTGIFKSGGGAPGRGGHERRMLPRIAIAGDSLLVAWCDAPMDGSSVRMLLSESRDGGQSFGDPVPVNQSDAARPTFTALAANESGQVVASWLDCRSGPQKVFAAIRPVGSSVFTEEFMVFGGQDDKGVCPCCPTESCVLADSTVLVAYRSQVDGFRDTWICRRSPGSDRTISTPMPVVPPTWKFDGCPHDGPSLAVSGEWVHVAWMDAHTGRQRTYYGRAKLADMKFDVQELNAAGPGTQGNAKLSIDHAGRLHAVWEESLEDEESPAAEQSKSAEGKKGDGGHQHALPTGAGRVIMHACSQRADGQFESAKPVSPSPGHFQLRPAIASGPDGLLVSAWMELDESGKRVVITVISGEDQTNAKP